MIKKIFKSKTRNFTLAAFVIAASTIVSGFLGVFRDRLLAGTFGAGETLDIYFVAFRIPDLVQAILVAGGISVAFLPIFSEEYKKGKGFEFASNLLNVLMVSLIGICLVLFFLTPWLMKIIAPGFNQVQIDRAILLTRIMFLSPVLFGLSSIFSGILQYFDHFVSYSLAPILYNLGIISGIVFFVPLFGIYGLGLGVVVGALAHFLVQVPSAIQSGFRWKRIFSLENYRLKRVVQLMSVSSVGFVFVQLNLIVVTSLASTLSSGSISILNFSRNLQSLPVNVIGVPFAVALFPVLSRAWTNKNKKKFLTSFSSGLRRVLLLVIPISVLMFVLRAQIVRIILGTGLWGWDETRLTAACLGIFSFSIIALSLVAFLRKSFFSIQETKIPALAEILNFVLILGFSFLFLFLLSTPLVLESIIDLLKLENMKDIRIIAFPLAISLASIFQMILLFILFIKKTQLDKLGQIFFGIGKIAFVSLIMGIVVWISLRPLAVFFPLTSFLGVLFQAGFGFLIGILIYVFGCFVFKVPELKNLWNSVFKQT